MSYARLLPTSDLSIVSSPKRQTNTIQAKHPKERHITVTGRSLPRGDGYVNVPQIILRGLYLEKIGLTIGSKVTVIESPGELIMRLDGPSGYRDPNETADDRRYARRMKRITDYQQNTRFPLTEDIIDLYVSGEMPYYMENIMSKLIDFELPEGYQIEIQDLLTRKRDKIYFKPRIEGLLLEIEELRAPKRKRSVKSKKPPENVITPSPKTPVAETLPASFAQDNLIITPALRVAEPSRPQEPNTSSNHILNVLRSLKPPPPHPPTRPSLREQLEKINPWKNPETLYPEIPLWLRQYFTADELKIHDACRSSELNAGKQSHHSSAQTPPTGS
jgi:hypothetical protein